jgi:molybdate transport system substrate-binding protein
VSVRSASMLVRGAAARVRRARRVAAVLLAAATAASLGACSDSAAAGDPGGSAASGASTGTGTQLTGTVTVLAAASLTESFDRLAHDFEARHPGVTVETSYGSSATLVQQVNNGAPASVLALAGTAAAGPLDRSLVKDSQNFASNVLEIAVPPGNPAGVTSIDDLAKPGVKVVLCADTAPCGAAAQATFRKAHVVPNVVSKEIDVKATLAKVRLGEADAAVVYHSDVFSSLGAVGGVAIPDQFNTRLEYPVVTLADDSASKAFVAFVVSRDGRATVQSFGLGAP